MAVARLRIQADGPYLLKGPATLVDARGTEFELPEGKTVALCRCGMSATKPFCNGNHADRDFRSQEPIERSLA